MDGYHRHNKLNKVLSPRQLQVLSLIAQGLTDKEIAIQIGRTPETVKNHGTMIREKLGAKNRAESAVIGIRRGLI